MPEFIDNPFRKMWEELDINEMKKDLCRLVDQIITAKDLDERNEILEEIDMMFTDLLVILELKDDEKLEAIRLDDIPQDILDEYELDPEEFEEGYVPVKFLPEEVLGMINKTYKKRQNNWILGGKDNDNRNRP